MLDALLALAGATLVVVAYLDALATAVVVREGAGPLTRRFTGLTWRLLLRLRRAGRGSRLLAIAGGGLLITTVLIWAALLWLGWTLVFLAGDPAVASSSDGSPAGPLDVAYFAGFTVFTLGVGDFVATSGPWRLVTALASFSGLFLITLAITYLISVVSAVVARRAVAVHIRGLGPDAGAIAASGWDGERFSSSYHQQLVTLTGAVATIAEQHLAYPVLHAFHSPHRGTSAPLALADLDDAVQLLCIGVADAHRAEPSATHTLDHCLRRYLDTASTTAPQRDDPEPPPLTLDPLVRGGIPVVDAAAFAAAVDGDRRRRMSQLVGAAGWSWSPTPDPSPPADRAAAR